MAQRFKIKGLRALERGLMEMSRATGKNVLKRALIEAGEPIAAAARRRAPHLSGYLKASIDTGTKLTKRQRRLHRKQSAVEVYVGAGGLPQAHLQEFGSGRHGAQPFLRPAWDGGRMQALNSIKAALARQIEKAAARIARKKARQAG